MKYLITIALLLMINCNVFSQHLRPEQDTVIANRDKIPALFNIRYPDSSFVKNRETKMMMRNHRLIPDLIPETKQKNALKDPLFNKDKIIEDNRKKDKLKAQ